MIKREQLWLFHQRQTDKCSFFGMINLISKNHLSLLHVQIQPNGFLQINFEPSAKSWNTVDVIAGLVELSWTNYNHQDSRFIREITVGSGITNTQSIESS